MSERLEVLLRGVSKAYPGVQALDDVDLTLRAGEIHGLLGQNGAGKSTLIKVLAGAIAPDTGTIVIGDELVALHSPADAKAAGIAIVHQDLQIVPALSVAENVTLSSPSCRRWGPVRVRDRRRDRVRAAAHLADLGIDLDVRAPAGSLRPPQRKMLEVARALASHDVRVLVLDEPTAALEPQEADHLFELLDRLRARGVAIVFVSHKLDEVFRMCDAVTVLRDGRVVVEADIREMDMGGLVNLVTGRDLEQVRAEDREAGEELLVAADVAVGSVGPADLVLRRGEVVALTGLLGSGNDEFGRALAGARGRRQGRVALAGRALAAGSRADATRHGLGFIPEDRKAEAVVPHLSIEQNIALASLGKVTRFGALSRRRMRAQAERYIELLDIRPPYPDMPLQHLSGGNQQKVIMARWLASDATVLVLEEPTHGLDVGAKADIHALLQRFAGDGGAVCMVSSELAEIVGLADRIGVFRAGRLVADLPRGVTEQEITARAVSDGEATA